MTSISGLIPNLFISIPFGVKYFATVTVKPEPSTSDLIDWTRPFPKVFLPTNLPLRLSFIAPEIQLNDVEWKVITNTPCKPATGKKTLSQGKWYYTTERFEYEEYFDEEKQETRRKVKRDADNNRIELPQLEDGNGVIQVCGNLQQKIAEVELMLDGEFVIFAITPVGYEQMSANLQEIKRYIGQQKDIIYYYREATAPKGKEGWLKENEERQEQQVEKAEADNEPVVETKDESGFSLKSLIPSIGDKD